MLYFKEVVKLNTFSPLDAGPGEVPGSPFLPCIRKITEFEYVGMTHFVFIVQINYRVFCRTQEKYERSHIVTISSHFSFCTAALHH